MPVPWINDYARAWRFRNLEYVLPKRTKEQFDLEGVQQAEMLAEFIEPDFTVLDYGIGVGRVAKNIQAEKVVGVDVTPQYISQVPKHIETYLTDGRTIPLMSETVDFAYSLMVLQHCPKTDHGTIISEIVRCLKPGGRAYIQFPDAKSDYYEDGPFVNVYTPDEVLSWVPDGCEGEIFEGRLAGYGDGKTVDRELILLVTKTS